MHTTSVLGVALRIILNEVDTTRHEVNIEKVVGTVRIISVGDWRCDPSQAYSSLARMVAAAQMHSRIESLVRAKGYQMQRQLLLVPLTLSRIQQARIPGSK